MDYTINGIEMPSVSKICGLIDKSEQLKQWAANEAVSYIEKNGMEDTALNNARTAYKLKSNTALDVGSSVHHAAEKYLLSGKTIAHNEPQAVKNGFTAFKNWADAHKPKILETEMTVYHPQLLYAGTYDLLCEIDGVLTMVDYKTSSDIWDTYWLQLAAYVRAREAISGEIEIKGRNGEYKIKLSPMEHGSIKQIAVLRLDKETGEYDFKIDKVPLWRRFKAFRGALDIFYNLKNTRRLKNNFRAKEG